MKFYSGHILPRDEFTHLCTGTKDGWELVLGKGYYEHVFARPPVEGHELPPIVVLKRRRFQIIRRKAEHACRVELRVGKRGNKMPCRFLAISGKKRCEPGYWTTINGRVGAVHKAVWGSDKIVSLNHIGQVAIWRSN